MAGAARHGDLRRLRTAYRLLRRITTLTALGYFVAFLLLSAFAKGLMERPCSAASTSAWRWGSASSR